MTQINSAPVVAPPHAFIDAQDLLTNGL